MKSSPYFYVFLCMCMYVCVCVSVASGNTNHYPVVWVFKTIITSENMQSFFFGIFAIPYHHFKILNKSVEVIIKITTVIL